MTDDHKTLAERIKRSAMCVYIATEVGPATDMAECFRQAAAAIESLSEQLERVEAERDAAVAEAIERCANAIEILTLPRAKGDDRDPEDELFFEFCEKGAKAIRALAPAAGAKENT